jgi:S-DNA-T family DNA segregation ATPase FtsK/SpoIIIE
MSTSRHRTQQRAWATIRTQGALARRWVGYLLVGYRQSFLVTTGILAIAIVVVLLLLADVIGGDATTALLLFGGGALFSTSRSRTKAIARLRNAWRRFRLMQVFNVLAGACFHGLPPQVRSIRSKGPATTVELGLRSQHSIRDVDTARDRIASALHVANVLLEPSAGRADRVVLRLLRDTLPKGPIRCPWEETAETNGWRPVPIGLSDVLDPVLVRLVGRSILIGGSPGSGKSSLLQLTAAWAALCPDMWLFTADGKHGMELGRWTRFTFGSGSNDISEVNEALAAILRHLERAGELLAKQGAREATPECGLRPGLVVIDELASFTLHPDKAAAKEFERLLHAIVSRGRAAGIGVVCATQRPSVDVVVGLLRASFSTRVAYHCADRDASDTILGAGMASRGYSAAELAPNEPGVCLVAGENDEPQRVKTFYLSDRDLDAIVARSRRLRQC